MNLNFIKICTDFLNIAKRERRMTALSVSELSYRRLFETAKDGILLINATTGKVEDVNPFLINLLGYSYEEYRGKHLWDLGFFVDIQKSREAFKELQEKGYIRFEDLPLRTSDGRTIQVEFVSNVYWVKDIKVIQCNIRDITQRKKLEKRLEHLANYDELTGLSNRALLFVRANAGLAQSRRNGKNCAVLFIDMDHFKNINDTLGHSAGDELIKDAANKLLECVREMDTVARLGGDEFIVFMGDLDSGENARYLAERIREKFNKSRLIAGNDIFITVSTGIVTFPSDGNDLETLLKNADIAMYSAKENGGNKYCFFDLDMNNRALRKMHVEHGLHQALDKSEFQLYYQPIVSVNGSIRGFEALLRWFPAGGESSPPEEFIPVAQETGLIVVIGEWVMNEACRFNKRLIDFGRGRPIISVNVSVEQLRKKDFIDMLSSALEKSGLPPECLEIEITESLPIQSFDDAVMILKAVRLKGVKVALDDFGTGYSSLTHLESLPISQLKIDRFFVSEVIMETDNNVMISVLIDLAHKLNLPVVAEGVETVLQMQKLSNCACDFFQGYLFSKAVPENEAVALYMNKHSPNSS